MNKIKSQQISLFAFLFLLSLVAATAKANNKKILFVSDIDDTIKVSHVLSSVSKVGRATDVTTPFRGFAELYQLVSQSNSSLKMVYLSNAPSEIGGLPLLKTSHQTFLAFNGFPKGELNLREDIFTENHKINELRRLIDSEMPTYVILIGDNGEIDPTVYEQITKDFAAFPIRFHVYIHQLYATEAPFFLPKKWAEIGQKLKNGQIGFVTPIEVAISLNQKGFLTDSDLTSFNAEMIPAIINESRFKWDGLRPITFPHFKKCADFKWSFVTTPEHVQLLQKIEYHCGPSLD